MEASFPIPIATNRLTVTQCASVLVAIAKVVPVASVPDLASSPTNAILTNQTAPALAPSGRVGFQGGRVSIVVVGHSPAAAVIAQLDGELVAIHLAVLVRIGLPHAAGAPVVGAVIVPDLDAEPIFLWTWRLEVSGMDADACVAVGCSAQ
jgi:hypothetical protein